MNIIDTVMTGLAVLGAMVSAAHALISKRDPKAAIGWIAVCILIPFGGPFLYYLFGINRVRTRAEKLQRRSDLSHVEFTIPSYGSNNVAKAPETDTRVKGDHPELVNVSDIITNRTLVGGNLIQVLHNGEQAYPAMLAEIENAQRSIFLATYIFECNETGHAFVDELSRASQRGVDVRVMVDGLRDVLSVNRASRLLKKRGIPVARFLPPRLMPPTVPVNLRNHRKILVADGEIGFTGGINIGDSYLAERSENPNRVVDLHFRIKGPIVKQLEAVFREDWEFLTGFYNVSVQEDPVPAGSSVCRVITEGPNEDIDKLALILISAASVAQKSIVIMTPYFIPPRGLLAALQSAALRGLSVNIILPAKNDSLVVHWATRNLLWELLERGVNVYYQPPPFVHTKLVIIDNYYVHIGSANIDPRSLRLNFELAVEVFDISLAENLTNHVRAVIKRSRAVTLEDIDNRSLPVRLRDSLAWLLSPYL